jgi:hypothetical protein
LEVGIGQVGQNRLVPELQDMSMKAKGKKNKTKKETKNKKTEKIQFIPLTARQERP